jgi:hypothetical protein
MNRVSDNVAVSALQVPADRFDCTQLHGLHDVAVAIQGDLNRGMAVPLGHDLGVDTDEPEGTRPVVLRRLEEPSYLLEGVDRPLTGIVPGFLDVVGRVDRDVANPPGVAQDVVQHSMDLRTWVPDRGRPPWPPAERSSA